MIEIDEARCTSGPSGLRSDPGDVAVSSCSGLLSIPFPREPDHRGHIERFPKNRAAECRRGSVAGVAGHVAAHEHHAAREQGVMLLQPRVQLERGAVAEPDVDEQAVGRRLLDTLLGLTNAFRRVDLKPVILELTAHDHADGGIVVDIKHGWHLFLPPDYDWAGRTDRKHNTSRSGARSWRAPRPQLPLA